MPAIAKKKLKIGDKVNVRLGNTTWRALIVEDRGRIGINGRQLFRVQLLDDQHDAPQFVEVPHDNIDFSSH